MADDNNEGRHRRMDLNLYLGLPRSLRLQSSHLGLASDLSLGSFSLSILSTAGESHPPLQMSTSARDTAADSPAPLVDGPIPPNASSSPPTRHGADEPEEAHSPYNPVTAPPLPSFIPLDSQEAGHDPSTAYPPSRNEESLEYRFRRLIESSHSHGLRRVRRFQSFIPYHHPSHDVLTSHGPSQSSGKHKVPAEAVAPEGSEENEEEKSNGAANFECNICLEMAREPVVTSCGHLFCWPCLFQWLHVHSEHNECPVCKGEVVESNITPIYGRGRSEVNDSRKLADDGESNAQVPPRPRGNRFESFRQQLRPISRRFREGLAASWRRVMNHLMRDRRFNGNGDFSALPGDSLSNIITRRLLRDEFNAELGPEVEEIRPPQGRNLHPLLRDGVDPWPRNRDITADARLPDPTELWNGINIHGLSATADIVRVVDNGGRYGASTSSLNHPSPEQLIPRADAVSASAADQVSSSSTVAVIHGDGMAGPNSAASSRSYRRERSSPSSSLDVDEVLHERKRRRLN